MDLREKVRAGLAISSLTGVEIGPLCWPMIRREEGHVLYVDHASTEELRAKYAGDPRVDPDQIVQIDGVWGAQSLRDCLAGRQVDYVVASHVIEHVPDLIAWLGEIEDILTPGGQLRVIVPDRRFTFDFFRRPTRLEDILVANLLKARRPGLQQLVDAGLNGIYLEGPGPILRGEITAKDAPCNLPSALEIADRFFKSDEYLDVHCWIFSPEEFARLFEAGARVGLIRFRCARFFDTEHGASEFVVHLEKHHDLDDRVATWRDMAVKAASGTVGGAEQELARVKEQLAAVSAQLEAVRNSKSWRLTAPVRAAMSALRRVGPT